MTEASKHSGKTLAYHGVCWDETCGYAQAVQVKDVIYVSGQLSHDEEGNLVVRLPPTRRAGSPTRRTWKRRCGPPL